MVLVILLILLPGGLIGLGISVHTAAAGTPHPYVPARILGEQPPTEVVSVVNDVGTATTGTKRVHDRPPGGAAIIAAHVASVIRVTTRVVMAKRPPQPQLDPDPMRGYKVRLNLRSDCNSAIQAPLPH